MEIFVASCKESAIFGMQQFLKSFAHVPEDKLEWSPTSSSKSALQIAAHTALTAGHFAEMIRERRLPAGEEIPDFIANRDAAERNLIDRAEIATLLQKNTDAVILAMDSVTPEILDIKLNSSLGWFLPMKLLMTLPGTHALGHAAQIDYLQTCWGDLNIYFS